MARPKLYYTREEAYKRLKYLEMTLKELGVPDWEIENRLAHAFDNTIIIKYSKKEQDEMMEKLYDIILNTPGGYWYIVNNMDYMPEFEYYKFKNMKSEIKEIMKENKKNRRKNRNIYKESRYNI